MEGLPRAWEAGGSSEASAAWLEAALAEPAELTLQLDSLDLRFGDLDSGLASPSGLDTGLASEFGGEGAAEQPWAGADWLSLDCPQLAPWDTALAEGAASWMPSAAPEPTVPRAGGAEGDTWGQDAEGGRECEKEGTGSQGAESGHERGGEGTWSQDTERGRECEDEQPSSSGEWKSGMWGQATYPDVAPQLQQTQGPMEQKPLPGAMPLTALVFRQALNKSPDSCQPSASAGAGLPSWAAQSGAARPGNGNGPVAPPKRATRGRPRKRDRLEQERILQQQQQNVRPSAGTKLEPMVSLASADTKPIDLVARLAALVPPDKSTDAEMAGRAEPSREARECIRENTWTSQAETRRGISADVELMGAPDLQGLGDWPPRVQGAASSDGNELELQQSRLDVSLEALLGAAMGGKRTRQGGRQGNVSDPIGGHEAGSIVSLPSSARMLGGSTPLASLTPLSTDPLRQARHLPGLSGPTVLDISGLPLAPTSWLFHPGANTPPAQSLVRRGRALADWGPGSMESLLQSMCPEDRDLRERLLALARAVASGDTSAQAALMPALKADACQQGSPMQRATYYFMRALVLRAKGPNQAAGPVMPSSSFMCTQLGGTILAFMERVPYRPFWLQAIAGFGTSVAAGHRVIHIVDFGPWVGSWPLFFQRLARMRKSGHSGLGLPPTGRCDGLQEMAPLTQTSKAAHGQLQSGPACDEPSSGASEGMDLDNLAEPELADDPILVRFTAVMLPEGAPRGSGPPASVQGLKKELEAAAARSQVGLEFSVIELPTALTDFDPAALQRCPGECLIICINTHLDTLPDASLLRYNPRDSFLKVLRRMEPTAIMMNSMAFDLNMPFFLKRFHNALTMCLTMMQSFETAAPRSHEARYLFESRVLSAIISNLVACEGSFMHIRPDGLRRLRSRMEGVGLELQAARPAVLDEMRLAVSECYSRDFQVQDRKGMAVLSYAGVDMTLASAWQPTLSKAGHSQ